MPTDPATDTAPSWAGWIDPASKLGALSLAAVYAIGYLVTSIHLAGIGVGFANPLKPRTAAAGVLFCVLFGIPAWIGERVLNGKGSPLQSVPEESAIAYCLQLARFYGICFGISLSLARLFAFTNLGHRRFWAIGILVVLESAFGAAARTRAVVGAWTAKHVNALFLVYSFLLTAYVAIPATTLRSREFTLPQVSLWLFVCGVFVQTARFMSKNRLGGPLPELVIQSLTPILVFASWIYPHVKSEWGGGQPVDIVAHFTKDSSVFASQKVSMRLVDEADAGFYVVLQNQERVVFLPRGDVAAIAYSKDLSSTP